MSFSEEEMLRKRRRRKICHGTGIAVLTILLLTAAALFIHLENEARHVLREAKNAQLAVKVVSIEYYGLEQPVCDLTSPSGFTEDALAAIRYYSGIEGELFLISMSEDGVEPASLIYISGKGYVATYGVQEPGWVVSRSMRLSADTKVR